MASESDPLKLQVATPLGLVLSTATSSVQAPSVSGEFGVLPGHLPVLAALKCGVLSYVVDGKKHIAAVGPGFVKANASQVELLTDLFIEPKDIDTDVATKELAEAEEKLKAFAERHEGQEYNELQRDIDWAVARIDAYAANDAL